MKYTTSNFIYSLLLKKKEDIFIFFYAHIYKRDKNETDI